MVTRPAENLLAQTLWQIAYAAIVGGGVGVTGWRDNYPPAVVIGAFVLFALATFLLLHSVTAGEGKPRVPANVETKGTQSPIQSARQRLLAAFPFRA